VAGRDRARPGRARGRLPTVTAACRAQGVDPVTDYIPVVPGAHYSCGGIAADRVAGPASRACTRSARRPAPACTGPTGWPPTPWSRPSSWAATPVSRYPAGQARKASRWPTSHGMVVGANGTGASGFTSAGAGVPDGNCDFLGEYRGEGHSYLSVGSAARATGAGARPASRAALAAAMSRYAGVVRIARGSPNCCGSRGLWRLRLARADRAGHGRIRGRIWLVRATGPDGGGSAGGDGWRGWTGPDTGGSGSCWWTGPEAGGPAGGAGSCWGWTRRERLGSREALAGVGAKGLVLALMLWRPRTCGRFDADRRGGRCSGPRAGGATGGGTRRRPGPRVRHTLMRWTPDGLAVNVR